MTDATGAADPRSCWGFPSAWSLFCFAVGFSSLFRRNAVFDPESLGRWDRDSVREVDAVSGGLMLVSRDVFVRLGGFDETFFMYSEDIDFCARARALGYRAIVNPVATAIHPFGGSSTRAEKMILVMQGKATYVRRNWSGLRRTFGLAMLWLGVALRAAGARAAGGERGAAWRATWSARRSWLAGYGRRTDGQQLHA